MDQKESLKRRRESILREAERRGFEAAVFFNEVVGQNPSNTVYVLPMALGLCLAVGSLVELGGVILGFFLLVIFSTMEIYPLAKSWPFILIWIAVMVVVGYLRSKAAKKNASS